MRAFCLLSLMVVLATSSLALADNANTQDETGPKTPPQTAKSMLEQLVGSWEGNCRTWFRPGKLADESAIAGTIVPVLDGRFLRHTYEGKIRDKARRGEELLAYNGVTETWQSSWFDSFHMNYAIMFSEGKPIANGFEVRGHYDVGKEAPRWGWRTTYELIDDDHLTITAYNISPEGAEAKAVETVYRRVDNR